MAYRIVDDLLGAQPIAEASATQRHALGTMVRAVDPTYGEGVFLYLAGGTDVTAACLVRYDQRAGTTSLNGLDVYGPVAVAMAATDAGLYGWFQVRGAAVVQSNDATAGTQAYAGEDGAVASAAQAGNKLDGMAFKTNGGVPSSGLAVCEIAFPSANGNGEDPAP